MKSSLHESATGTTMALRAFARFPGRIAFVWDGGSLTYRGARDLIGSLQAAMAAAGLVKGQTAAFLSANSAEMWCAGVAAAGLGLVTTWLHPLGALDDQLDVIEDAEATALIVDPKTHAARGGELAARAGQRLAVVLTMGPADFGRDVRAAADKIGSATPIDLTDPDDYAVINYTGGTTGKSKGAIRRHRSTAAMTLAVAADFEFPTPPRYLAAAPITHVAGTKVLPSLLKGGTVHLLKGFEPEKFLATIEREKINFTLVVPTMIYVLLDHPRLDHSDLSSLELILYGASPMSPTRLVEGLERIGPVFSQLYGQTECYPVSVLGKADHDARRPELFASCGFPIASCSVSLRDEDNNEVKPGDAGEICVRAPQAMEQYWKRPEQTAETLKGGWLHTGDSARRRARLSLHRRSQEGHDRLGRLQHLPARSGRRAVISSRRRHGRGDRCAAREVGRGRRRLDRREARHAARRRSVDAAREGSQGQHARAQASRVRRELAAHRCRQGRQEGPAREVLGREVATGRMTLPHCAWHAR